MKKLILLLVSMLFFVSCSTTTYNVSFIDFKNQSDTLNTQITILERSLFRGEDSYFDVRTYNSGTKQFPVFIYTLCVTSYFNTTVIYSSSCPIIVTDFKVMEQ